ncbi:MBL fold metallo-hydrolase [Ilumatobacter sp.]|uniref:MBL fold metallo-hydrolase n=1 Tax=Ilumatobacter sp. TaxID=1967498 RepID=UPI003B5205B4
MTWWTSPPATDEIEITVLGRGIGESIVVHVGNGMWTVIDSFIEAEIRGAHPGDPTVRNREPSASRYLEHALHLNVEDVVVSIVLTHLHNDHFAGIGELVRRCKRAPFYVPYIEHAGERGLQALEAFGQSDRGELELRGVESVVNAWRRSARRPGAMNRPAHGPDMSVLDADGALAKLTAIAPIGGLAHRAHVLSEDPTVDDGRELTVALTGVHANLSSVVIWL